MVDFKKLRFSIECPHCGGKMQTTVFETAMESNLVCKTCGQTQRVFDEGGSLKNGISNMELSHQAVEASMLSYLKSRD